MKSERKKKNMMAPNKAGLNGRYTMYLSKKVIVVMLILSILSYYFPKVVFAGQSRLLAKANTAINITEYKPEILSLPAEDIPIEKVEEAVEGEKKKWLWYVLAGVAVVGLIAAAGGGGGGGDDDGPTGPTTGKVKVSW